jgi:magnesium chelatase family protein
MSLARLSSFTLDGVTARGVWVEADVRKGLPAFAVVGLADMAVREARERVRAAITNSGFVFPDGRITVNLAPAYLRKIGPGFDLPLAVAIIAAGGELGTQSLAGTAVVGELSLNGDVRAVRGALAIAEAARAHGIPRLVVPRSRAREAALVRDLAVVGSSSSRRPSKCCVASASRRRSRRAATSRMSRPTSPTSPTSAATTG